MTNVLVSKLGCFHRSIHQRASSLAKFCCRGTLMANNAVAPISYSVHLVYSSFYQRQQSLQHGLKQQEISRASASRRSERVKRIWGFAELAVSSFGLVGAMPSIPVRTTFRCRDGSSAGRSAGSWTIPKAITPIWSSFSCQYQWTAHFSQTSRVASLYIEVPVNGWGPPDWTSEVPSGSLGDADRFCMLGTIRQGGAREQAHRKADKLSVKECFSGMRERVIERQLRSFKCAGEKVLCDLVSE